MKHRNNTIIILVFSVIIFLEGFISYKKITEEPVNKEPVANAGDNQVITQPTDSVILDGSASADPDGTITAYK